jgi:hypothetical protein
MYFEGILDNQPARFMPSKRLPRDRSASFDTDNRRQRRQDRGILATRLVVGRRHAAGPSKPPTKVVEELVQQLPHASSVASIVIIIIIIIIIIRGRSSGSPSGRGLPTWRGHIPQRSQVRQAGKQGGPGG